MTLTFDWFLPTSGDGRTIYGRGSAGAERELEVAGSAR